MSDLEMTILCAAAIGVIPRKYKMTRYTHGDHWLQIQPRNDRSPSYIYDPLHNDAQAMALVKKFRLNIWASSELTSTQSRWRVMGMIRDKNGAFEEPNSWNNDLNRAICMTVAKMQKAKA